MIISLNFVYCVVSVAKNRRRGIQRPRAPRPLMAPPKHHRALHQPATRPSPQPSSPPARDGLSRDPETEDEPMTDWHAIAQAMAADLEGAAAGIDSDDLEVMCNAHDLIVDGARRWRHEIWLAELADSTEAQPCPASAKNS
jgi:hypothetical protein